MPTTPIYALPYPADGDPADVPLDMQELAERLELVFPGKELAYAEFTAAVTLTVVAEASSVTLVTAPAVTFAGETVEIDFHIPQVGTGTVLGNAASLYLFDGSTSLGLIARQVTPAAATLITPLNGLRRLTPSAGSHTYSLRGRGEGTAATAYGGTGGPGGILPGYIRVRRV